MTIVAGFRVKDGVLMCADTKYSGIVALHQDKLFPVKFNSDDATCSLIFALSGHDGFGKTAIEDCQEAIEACPGKDWTFPNIKRILRRVIKSVNEEYVDTRPVAERDAARFDLLISVCIGSEGKARLFATSGTTLVGVKTYECAGSGSFIGHYILKSYRRNMRTEDAISLATRAIGAAKEYDPYCGGKSAFIVHGDDGTIKPLSRYDAARSLTA